MIQLSNSDTFSTIQRPAAGQAGQQSQECQAQALVTCNLMLRNSVFFLQRKSRDIKERDKKLQVHCSHLVCQ